MRALVTGVGGFVGSAVARELLRQGFEVRALVRKGGDRRNLLGLDVELAEGDVRNVDSLAEAMRGCQNVFHLAALYSHSEGDVGTMYAVNVGGTKSLLELARRGGVERFVHTSTIGTIGRTTVGSLPTEDTPFDLWESSSHYVRSKYLGEQAVLAAGREGLSVVVVHPCAPVGPGDIRPTVTGQRIVDFLKGELPSWVPGGINFVDVEDVAKGHTLAATRGRPGRRYLLGSRNLGLEEFLGLLELVTGMKAPRVRGADHFLPARRHLAERSNGSTPREGPRSLTCDCSRSVLELGLPQTPLELALEKAANWFRENGYVKRRQGRRWIW